MSPRLPAPWIIRSGAKFPSKNFGSNVFLSDRRWKLFLSQLDWLALFFSKLWPSIAATIVMKLQNQILSRPGGKLRCTFQEGRENLVQKWCCYRPSFAVVWLSAIVRYRKKVARKLQGNGVYAEKCGKGKNREVPLAIAQALIPRRWEWLSFPLKGLSWSHYAQKMWEPAVWGWGILQPYLCLVWNLRLAKQEKFAVRAVNWWKRLLGRGGEN